jgi:hypothetical protein
MTNLTERFFELFKGRETSFGYCVPGGVDPLTGKVEAKYGTENRSLFPEDKEKHIDGEKGIGIIPLTNNNECYFAGIDIDVYDIENKIIPRVLEDLLITGVPLIPCQSKSGGLHLFAFFEEAVPSEMAIALMKRFASLLRVSKYTDNKGDVRDIEIFPKQVKASVGSFINLPYFGDTKKAVDVNTGTLLSLTDFIEKAETLKLSKKRVADNIRKDTADAAVSDPEDPLYHAPPCLVIMIKIHKSQFGAGIRNEMLFNFAVYFNKRYGDDFKEYLLQFNQEYCSPPVGEDEVEKIVSQVSSKEYFYKCQSAPIADVCNKTVCRQRNFGLGSELSTIEFGDLTIVNGDPKIYLWTIDDTEVALSADEISSPAKLNVRIMEATNKMAGLDKKMITENYAKSFEKARYMDVGIENTPTGQLIYHLKEFLEHRKQDFKTKEDMINIVENGMSSVKNEHGVYYFKMQSFHAYLSSIGFREFNFTEVSNLLKNKIGVVATKLHKTRYSIRCYKVDEKAFEEFDKLAGYITKEKEENDGQN